MLSNLSDEISSSNSVWLFDKKAVKFKIKVTNTEVIKTIQNAVEKIFLLIVKFLTKKDPIPTSLKRVKKLINKYDLLKIP